LHVVLRQALHRLCFDWQEKIDETVIETWLKRALAALEEEG
jgi:hypothetical protein